ncbi:hypothetical protein [Rhodospirillaceae bacterium SYSU D60014]|uniref:hypothetical protein n=1 Tax=Virgifigura deserti TaxID=2268457 RepID=UPI0013C4A806
MSTLLGTGRLTSLLILAVLTLLLAELLGDSDQAGPRKALQKVTGDSIAISSP